VGTVENNVTLMSKTWFRLTREERGLTLTFTTDKSRVDSGSGIEAGSWDMIGAVDRSDAP
jgi:hypothetical protein